MYFSLIGISKSVLYGKIGDADNVNGLIICFFIILFSELNHTAINGKKTTVLEDFDCRQQKSIAKINGYTDLINNYLNKNPVHPEITPPIIKSFIALESNGDPLAVNGREPGGRVSAGLMQLIS